MKHVLRGSGSHSRNRFAIPVSGGFPPGSRRDARLTFHALLHATSWRQPYTINFNYHIVSFLFISFPSFPVFFNYLLLPQVLFYLFFLPLERRSIAKTSSSPTFYFVCISLSFGSVMNTGRPQTLLLASRGSLFYTVPYQVPTCQGPKVTLAVGHIVQR